MPILPLGADLIKEALRPISIFCIPTQLGPITLIPASLHFLAISASIFFPFSSISPNPADTMIMRLTFFSMH